MCSVPVVVDVYVVYEKIIEIFLSDPRKNRPF